MTERHWKEYSKARPSVDIRIPENVLLECVELILDGDNLEEVQRLPGENDVSSLSTSDRNQFKTKFDFSSLVRYGGVAHCDRHSRVSKRT